MKMTTSTSYGTGSYESTTYLELAGRIDWSESGTSTGAGEAELLSLRTASQHERGSDSWLSWAA